MVERFWPKVDRSAYSPGGCWEWQGGVVKNGYGRFYSGIKSFWVGAHQFSFMLEYGPIPEGLIICHRCDNPRCCNPAHLYAGTHADNARDCSKRGRWNGRRKIPFEQRSVIRSKYAGDRVTKSALAREYQVSVTAITKILREA